MRLRPFNPNKELKKLNRRYNKKYLIVSLLILIIMISVGQSYAIFSIVPQYHTIINSKIGEFSTGDIKFSILVDGKEENEFPDQNGMYFYDKIECENGSTGVWNNNTWKLSINTKGPDKCIINFIKAQPLTELLYAQYTEGATTGLIKDNENPNIYYYKGNNDEVSNNYLWYGGHQWRILEFDNSAKTITLISQQPLTNIQLDSNVWTTSLEYKNNYLNKWLNNFFYNSLEDNVKSNILSSTFNIGNYANVEELTITQNVGLLDYNQYIRAGGINSFLNVMDNFWLSNGNDSSKILIVSYDGNFFANAPVSTYGIRPVIKISDIKIVDGNGSMVSNFKSRNYFTAINQIQIGDYVNVPYDGNDNACGVDNKCTFRVVSKDSDSVKVVFNGLLPNTSNYGSSSKISLTSNIYTLLNQFANNISEKYRYSLNKNFYIGDYPLNLNSAQDYESVKDETLQFSVGLPTIGEMFSGNDIDMSLTNLKTFVDITTIENSSVAAGYWTMNRYSGSQVRFVDQNGDLTIMGPSNIGGIRPVIFLNNKLTFTSGDGTPQDPYNLA